MMRSALSIALLSLPALAVPWNQNEKLEPPSGGWRGAVVDDSRFDSVDAWQSTYGFPLHIKRVFKGNNWQSLTEDELAFVEDGGVPSALHGAAHDGKPERFYTAQEYTEIVLFRSKYLPSSTARTANFDDDSPRRFQPPGSGPWGDPSRRNDRARNSWDSIDATSSMVRGPAVPGHEDVHHGLHRGRDRVLSGASLCDLGVLDMFMCADDVQEAWKLPAGPVSRMRSIGEERRLLLFNFRIVPLHVVAVFVVPDHAGYGPAHDLFFDFLQGMSDGERRERLKAIPRVVRGPWVVQHAIGSDLSALLAEQVETDFFPFDGGLEISVAVSDSPEAARLCRVLSYAAKVVDVECAFVLEGRDEEELPEQVLGGFRVRFPDLDTCRSVVLEPTANGHHTDGASEKAP
jgi:hypothetical protein